MTRRELLARSLPMTLLSAAALAMLPGCEGGGGGSDMAKVPADRQAEIDKANEASEKAAKEEAAKKK